MVRILLSTRLGELRMTQTELARKTGIRSQTINDWYHEITDSIKLEHLDVICKVLNCEIWDLLVQVDGDQRDHKTLPVKPQKKT